MLRSNNSQELYLGLSPYKGFVARLREQIDLLILGIPHPIFQCHILSINNIHGVHKQSWVNIYEMERGMETAMGWVEWRRCCVCRRDEKRNLLHATGCRLIKEVI